LGVRGAKRGCFAIGAIEQGNGCRYASTWRAVLGDIGKRLDGFRRVLARKLLDAVRGFGATTRFLAVPLTVGAISPRQSVFALIQAALNLVLSHSMMGLYQ
jgi:hypothetical protein